METFHSRYVENCHYSRSFWISASLSWSWYLPYDLWCFFLHIRHLLFVSHPIFSMCYNCLSTLQVQISETCCLPTMYMSVCITWQQFEPGSYLFTCSSPSEDHSPVQVCQVYLIDILCTFFCCSSLYFRQIFVGAY